MHSFRSVALRAGACLLAFAAVLVPSTPSVASFYPPDYVIESRCQTSGPVEVCAINQHYGNYPRLTVRYRGGLQATQWGRLSAWVELNGRSNTFRMTNTDYVDSVALNDPDTYLCYAKDPQKANQEIPAGPYDLCKRTEAEGGPLVWEATPVPPAESELFFYAKDERGLANAWDVQVAVVADDGRWDSQAGRNYRFRFEP